MSRMIYLRSKDRNHKYNVYSNFKRFIKGISTKRIEWIDKHWSCPNIDQEEKNTSDSHSANAKGFKE